MNRNQLVWLSVTITLTLAALLGVALKLMRVG
jgi:hypothetical protein